MLDKLLSLCLRLVKWKTAEVISVMFCFQLAKMTEVAYMKQKGWAFKLIYPVQVILHWSLVGWMGEMFKTELNGNPGETYYLVWYWLVLVSTMTFIEMLAWNYKAYRFDSVNNVLYDSMIMGLLLWVRNWVHLAIVTMAILLGPWAGIGLFALSFWSGFYEAGAKERTSVNVEGKVAIAQPVKMVKIWVLFAY